MQIYIDLIKHKVASGKLDLIKSGIQDTVLNLDKNGLIKQTDGKLETLHNLCNLLQAIHYIAGVTDLPIDDAYSAMLTTGNIFAKDAEKITPVDPVEAVTRIFNLYESGKLKKAASPIHALMERIDEVKRGLQVELSEKKTECLTLGIAVDSLKAEITPLKAKLAEYN